MVTRRIFYIYSQQSKSIPPPVQQKKTSLEIQVNQRPASADNNQGGAVIGAVGILLPSPVAGRSCARAES